MTLHQAIKNSNGISKLTNLVGGKEELVINATEAIINKNMKGLTNDQKEKCINDKTYIENQIVGIMEALKSGSTVYSKVYERTTRFEGTADMYATILEGEEKFEEIKNKNKEEKTDDDKDFEEFFKITEDLKEGFKDTEETIKGAKENLKRKMGSSNEEEDQKRLNKKGFLDYVTAPFKYIGKKIVQAATFIGEKISDGFNKLKGLFGKKEAKGSTTK